MEVRPAIRSFIAENFFFDINGSTYSDSDSFLKEGILDSLGVMDLVSFAGSHFGICVLPAEVTAANFDSVENLAKYVERKRQAAPGIPGEQPCGIAA